MTTPLQTRCPQCHGYFNISEAQVNQADAKGRCGRCKHVFLINNYLNDNELEFDNEAENSSSQESLFDTSIHSVDTDNIIPFNSAEPIEHKYRDTAKNFQLLTYKKDLHIMHNNDDEFLDDLYVTDDHEAQNVVNDEHHDSDSSNHGTNTKANINKLYDDTLLESESEYDSVDKMDVWLSGLTSEDSKTIRSEDLDHTTGSSHIKLDKEYNLPLEDDIAHNTQTNDILSSDSDTPLNTEISTLKSAPVETVSLNKHHDRQTTKTDLNQLLANMNDSVENHHISDKEHESITQSRKALKQKRFESSIATAFWLAGCLVLALLLGAQYIIFNLDNLVKNPAHAARLQSFCSVLACSLPSADINTLKVDNVSYIPSNVNTVQGFSDIRANIINQNTQAQLLPNLKVSVYGSNAIIGEFIATPDKYVLSTEHQINAEQVKAVMFTVKVPINQIGKVTIEPMY